MAAQDEKISALTAASSLNDADINYIVQGGISKKFTFTVLKAFLKTYFDTLYVQTGASIRTLLGISTLSGSNTGDQTLPVKASAAEINTGTDDTKFATSKSITDSNVAFLADIPVKCSGAEITTGTDDTKFSTPKALTDAGLTPVQFAAGTALTLAEANTERTTTNTSYVKVKEITITRAGTFAVSFDLKSSSDGSGAEVYGRIYKNDEAVGTQRMKNDSAYTTYAENLTFAVGDKVQLYHKIGAAGPTCYVKNFNIKATIAGATVNTD